MVTQLPSTGKPGCDTSDMNMIHGMFRSILNEAPKLVRSVAQSDTEHAAAVAGHLSDLISGLHNHHHGEDLLLWDELAARAPACAALDDMGAIRLRRGALEIVDPNILRGMTNPPVTPP